MISASPYPPHTVTLGQGKARGRPALLDSRPGWPGTWTPERCPLALSSKGIPPVLQSPCAGLRRAPVTARPLARYQACIWAVERRRGRAHSPPSLLRGLQLSLLHPETGVGGVEGRSSKQGPSGAGSTALFFLLPAREMLTLTSDPCKQPAATIFHMDTCFRG